MSEPAADKPLRAFVLRVLLGFLVLTALVAIVDVWTDLDEDGKVLMSTFVISMASLLGLAGAARIDRSAKAPAGLATLLLASLAGLSTLWLIWVEPQDFDPLGRVILSSWLWALTCALHSLIGLAALPERSRWLGIAARRDLCWERAGDRRDLRMGRARRGDGLHAGDLLHPRDAGEPRGVDRALDASARSGGRAADAAGRRGRGDLAGREERQALSGRRGLNPLAQKIP